MQTQNRPPTPNPTDPIVAWKWFRSRPKIVQIGVLGGTASILMLGTYVVSSSMQPKVTPGDPALTALEQSKVEFSATTQKIKNELTAVDFDSKQGMGLIQRAVESESIAFNQRTNEVVRRTGLHEAIVKNNSLSDTQEWAETAASGRGVVVSWYSYRDKRWKHQPISPELTVAFAGVRNLSILGTYDETFKPTALVPMTQDMWSANSEWRESLAKYLEQQGATPVAQQLRASQVPFADNPPPPAFPQ